MRRMNAKSTPSQSIIVQPNEPQADAGMSLMFAWRHKWIVTVIVVLGLGLGYLYFLRQVPVYQSAAKVLLVQGGRANLPIQGLEVKTGYEVQSGTLATHQILISSPVVARL